MLPFLPWNFIKALHGAIKSNELESPEDDNPMTPQEYIYIFLLSAIVVCAIEGYYWEIIVPVCIGIGTVTKTVTVFINKLKK